jgi:transposase
MPSWVRRSSWWPVLTRSLIWDRTGHILRLRSVLREFFPAALEAFADLAAADTLELLAIAPDPDRAARMPKSKVVAVLRRANRRGVEEKAATIQSVWRAPAVRQPTQVQAAFAVIVTSQVRVITALNLEIGQLGEVVAHHFGRHRDAEIYASQPGLGVILAARVLAEFGDDRTRFADATARRNYAGTSPITRASGTRTVVLARYPRTERLGDATQQWAFGALKGFSWCTRLLPRASQPAKSATKQHYANSGNRLVGILHRCLKTGTRYDETTAWAHHHTAAA